VLYSSRQRTLGLSTQEALPLAKEVGSQNILHGHNYIYNYEDDMSKKMLIDIIVDNLEEAYARGYEAGNGGKHLPLPVLTDLSKEIVDAVIADIEESLKRAGAGK
jgi:hypothetical protein